MTNFDCHPNHLPSHASLSLSLSPSPSFPPFLSLSLSLSLYIYIYITNSWTISLGEVHDRLWSPFSSQPTATRVDSTDSEGIDQLDPSLMAALLWRWWGLSVRAVPWQAPVCFTVLRWALTSTLGPNMLNSLSLSQWYHPSAMKGLGLLAWFLCRNDKLFQLIRAKRSLILT